MALSDARGSALLTALGATAGLSVMASMLVLATLTAYEVAGVRHERAQARALAEGALRQLRLAVAGGQLPLPAVGEELVVVNGSLPDGTPVPVASFPSPPSTARWPAPASAPELAPAGGYGAAVELRLRVDPDGAPVAGPVEDTWLLQASVTAWFRRALVTLDDTVVALGGV